jgi:excisionase family DNA binding protein
MEELINALQSLLSDGEAKLEVSFRIVRKENETAMPKPYDPNGRIDGYREIAKRLGVSVNTVMGMARRKKIQVYKLGRKYCAYESELSNFLQ